ncbi:MAG: hypothetical protein JNG83_07940 [Opitutaceae bacterium]|nr:hypothetical protein [Opitutaceae bacterium]
MGISFRSMSDMDTYRTRQEAAAARESAAFDAGRSGSDYTGSYAEMQAHRAGKGIDDKEPRMSLFGLVPLLVVAVGFWPIVGAITLTTLWITNHVLWPLPQKDIRWGVVWGGGMLLAGCLAWKLSRPLERRAARHRWYRRTRQPIRLAWVAVCLGYACLKFSYGGAYTIWPDEITWQWIESKLRPGHYLFILAGVVVAQLLTARVDRILGGENTDHVVHGTPAVVRTRRRAGLTASFLVGGLAAVAAAVSGEPLGGVVATFVLVGGITYGCVVLYRRIRRK